MILVAEGTYELTKWVQIIHNVAVGLSLHGEQDSVSVLVPDDFGQLHGVAISPAKASDAELSRLSRAVNSARTRGVPGPLPVEHGVAIICSNGTPHGVGFSAVWLGDERLFVQLESVGVQDRQPMEDRFQREMLRIMGSDFGTQASMA